MKTGVKTKAETGNTPYWKAFTRIGCFRTVVEASVCTVGRGPTDVQMR